MIDRSVMPVTHHEIEFPVGHTIMKADGLPQKTQHLVLPSGRVDWRRGLTARA